MTIDFSPYSWQGWLTVPHRVVAVALPGLVTFDLACAVQVFAPEAAPPGRPQHYDFAVCGPTRRIVTNDGFDLVVPHGLDAVASADTVVVPGYLGDWSVPPHPRVLRSLAMAAERGARMMSICVGAFALGHAGLLDGHRATTHWIATQALADLFPRAEVVADVLYVDDGQVLTSAGLAGGMDLSLHVVRRDRGAVASAELARYNVVPPHRDGGQAQFIPAVVSSRGNGDELAGTCEWALQHLDQSLSLGDLAAHARLSTRTLIRRFETETGTSPKQWLLQARLTRARELLEATDLPIEHIAAKAGFPSAAALRAQFSSGLKTTPTAYRKAFRVRES